MGKTSKAKTEQETEEKKKKAPAKKAAAKKTTAPKKAAAEKKATPIDEPAKAVQDIETPKTAAPTESEVRQETYSSDLISLSVSKMPHCNIEFLVHAKAPLIEAAKQLGIKDLAKDVSIPGFRKGKAPLHLLHKRFPMAIEEKTFKHLADLSYREAQRLAHCPLLNGNSQISYDLKNHDLSKGVDMVYHFETEPVIPEIEYEKIDLSGIEKEVVDEKKIEETLEHIRSFYATHDVVKDRGVQKGDFILVNIDDLDFDPPSTVFKGSRFEVSENGMSEWMLDLVLGMNSDESKEGISRANQDDSEKIKAEFKPKKVRVTVTEIQEAKLPPIDDKLAQKLGVQSTEELHSQLKKSLEKRAENDFQEQLREKASQTLLEQVTFDIPKSVLEREFTHRFNHSLKDAQFKKEWDQMDRQAQEKFQRDLMEESERAIRAFYISRAIAQRNNIRIDRPEETPRPTSVLEAMFTNREMMHFDTKSEEEQSYLLSKLLLRKAQDFVVEKAKIVAAK